MKPGHVSDALAAPIAGRRRGVPFELEDLPCAGGCGNLTIMGSLCEACAEREQENARRDALCRATRGLRKQLKDCPKVGSPEFEMRVSSPKLRAFAERYTFARGNALVLGPTAIGKTTAMDAMEQRLIAEAIEARAPESPISAALRTTGLRLARVMREQRLGTTSEDLDQARRARVLFLDEIGQEHADPRWLLELLDDRYLARAITITTSGLTRGELEKRYGSGAFRRLVEPVGVVIDLFEATTT